MKLSQPTKKPVNYFQEKSNNGFKYDPKKTNQLLDEIVAVDQKIFKTEPQLTPILQNSQYRLKR